MLAAPGMVRSRKYAILHTNETLYVVVQTIIVASVLADMLDIYFLSR